MRTDNPSFAATREAVIVSLPAKSLSTTLPGDRGGAAHQARPPVPQQRTLRIEPDGLKGRGQGRDEVFQPDREIGLASTEVVVVMRMDGQSLIVAPQIAGVVLFQRKEAIQAVTPFVQDVGGQQAGSPAIAVLVGVDGYNY